MLDPLSQHDARLDILETLVGELLALSFAGDEANMMRWTRAMDAARDAKSPTIRLRAVDRGATPEQAEQFIADYAQLWDATLTRVRRRFSALRDDSSASG